jgi:predicted MFS family arabinose efflux permease
MGVSDQHSSPRCVPVAPPVAVPASAPADPCKDCGECRCCNIMTHPLLNLPLELDTHSDQLLENHEREVVLRVMSAASFLIMFQAYLIAPLIPALALQFHATAQRVGLLVPAYLLPYGCSTLFYGPLSDRIGRKPVLLGMLGMLIVATFGAAGTTTLPALMAWRIAAGLASGGIIPITLALLGDLFPYQERGRAIGWIFGAIAGGMAFGSTLGAILNPIIGWRAELRLAASGVSAGQNFVTSTRNPGGHAGLSHDPAESARPAWLLPDFL